MHVERTRLLQAITSTDTVCITAGTGFGKSVLGQQLRRTGAALFTPESLPVSVDDLAPLSVLDDAHRVSEEELLAVAAQVTNAGAQIVFIGRSLPPSLVEAADLLLRSDDLLMSDPEIAELVSLVLGEPNPQLSALLAEVSLRWPTAVSSLLHDYLREAAAGDGAIGRVARRSTQRTRLIAPLVSRLGDDLPLTRTLASLPFFDDTVLELFRVDPLTTRRQMALAGLPCEDYHGWYRFPTALRQLLIEEPHPLVEVKTGLLADHYRRRQEVIAAIDACLAFGDGEAAAEMLADFDFRETIPDVDQLNSRMALFRTALAQHPRALLVQWWANLDSMSMQVGLEALYRAETIVRSQVDPDPRLWAEVMLELGNDAYINADRDRAVRLLKESGAADGAFRGSTIHARMLEVQGGILTLNRDAPSLIDAQNLFTEAIEYWRREGETVRAVASMFRLAIHVLEPLGRHEDALSVLNDIEAQLGLTAIDSARVSVWRGRLLARLGRNEECLRATERADQAAAVLGLAWIEAFTAWTRLSIAPFSYDIDAVRESERAEDRLGDLITRDTGHMFYCEGAVALARVGELPAARDFLTKAASITAASPDLILATAWVEVEEGQAERAQSLAESVRPELEPGRCWEPDLVIAAAKASVRDWTSMHEHASNAANHAELTQLGDAVAALSASIEARWYTPPETDEPTGFEAAEGVRIEIFDGFRIAIGSATVPVPVGHAATLVKLVIAQRGLIKIDQAVDALWPEADLATGRRRLRNVLGRLRRAVDHTLLVRRGDTLALADDVTSDYLDTLAAADRSLRIEPQSPNAAGDAWRIMPAEDRLLVEERYADWALQTRSNYGAMRRELYQHLDTFSA